MLFEDLALKQQLIETDLKPLTKDETRTLVNLLWKKDLELPPFIYEEKGGNPFFIVESIHSNEWIDHHEMVQRVITSRLSVLPDTYKKLLYVAALYGRSFLPSFVVKVLKCDERTVSEMLDFTAMYLAHLETEENEIMSALRNILSIEDLMDISAKMRMAVPPTLMLKFLKHMLPAMNVTERTQLLTGIRKGAPAQYFESILNIAQESLQISDWNELRTNLEQTI